jgi:uncharacterized protein (DUF362 family)
LKKRLTRRRFISTGAACLASTIFIPGCGKNNSGGKNGAAQTGDDSADDDTLSADDTTGDDDTGANLPPEMVVLGLYTADSAASPREAVRKVCKALDWSWLAAGDSVLIKISCNSGNAHPAVTSPNALRAVIDEAFARGAGRVTVADQAGVASVRSGSDNRRYGSTRSLTESNGLLQAIEDSGAQAFFFDEQDYATGYFEATLPFSGSHWLAPPQIPEIIRSVDHIIYLPRLSSHMIAGYTHGHKCAVGWLRDDSRHEMHFKADSLHEKYVEINYCREIRDRHRLTITLAEKLLLDCGPDNGTIAVADPWIVIASSHLANHDAVSVAALAFIDDRTPPAGLGVTTPYGERSDLYNRGLLAAIPVSTGIPWISQAPGPYTALNIHGYQQGIASDRALSRAYEILGGVPNRIEVRTVGELPSGEFQAFLENFGGGIFNPST